MQIELVEVRGNWNIVLNAARLTANKNEVEKTPSEEWAKRIARAEHSPIRLIEFIIKVTDVKSWLVTHNVRHKIGIEHFVSTRRDDRTGIGRDNLPQSTLVDYQFCVNLQELIFIYRKRLCKKAHIETQNFWREIINFLLFNEQTKDIISPIIDLFVPECAYRGGKCPEIQSCKFNNTTFGKSLTEKFWSQ